MLTRRCPPFFVKGEWGALLLAVGQGVLLFVPGAEDSSPRANSPGKSGGRDRKTRALPTRTGQPGGVLRKIERGETWGGPFGHGRGGGIRKFFTGDLRKRTVSTYGKKQEDGQTKTNKRSVFGPAAGRPKNGPVRNVGSINWWMAQGVSWGRACRPFSVFVPFSFCGALLSALFGQACLLFSGRFLAAVFFARGFLLLLAFVVFWFEAVGKLFAAVFWLGLCWAF